MQLECSRAPAAPSGSAQACAPQGQTRLLTHGPVPQRLRQRPEHACACFQEATRGKMGQRAQNAPPGRAWRAMRVSTKRRTDRMLGSIAATVARALPEEAGRVRPCCLSCAVADPRAQELAPTKVGFRLRRARRGSGTRVHGSSWIPDVDRPQAHRGGQRHCSQRLH